MGGHVGVLGGLLQLRPQPADLRILQPGVQGGVQEDPAELLPDDVKSRLLEAVEAKGGAHFVQQRLQ
ncbi:hypothetical protein D910_00746 [Dendroctonus ponderosae]|uniref:Uncharacterized protein n=1 Tax=Dendroctonus ponderosae TaxID=77166 RepID=U4UZY6_DENPD|nr:hypothetical protein D910_00746 [Dendroctonus ponderosae]